MSNSKAYLWSAIDRFGTMAIMFIGNVFVARILTPDDYGLIGMLAIFMGIAMNFTDSGFSDCLIQKRDADQLDFKTVTTFNIVVGFLFYLAIYLVAPSIASFFKRAELIDIARILGLSILLKAITLTEFTKLRKELKFKHLALVNLISNIAMITASIFMAIKGYGYWALAYQALVLGAVKILMLIIIVGWIPKIGFHWKRFTAMSRYSFNLLVSYLVNQIGQNLYSVFIGKFQPTYSLGFYRQAEKLKDPSVMSVNAIVMSTSYSIIANEIDETKKRKMYQSLLDNFLFIHFLIITILIGSAYPLVKIVFGPKWVQSAEYFQLMLIASIFVPIMTVNANIAKISGRADLYRNLGFLRTTLSIIALLITGKETIHVILYGQIIAAYISVFIDSFICGRLIEFNYLQQFKAVAFQISRPILSMFLSFLISFRIENQIYRLGVYIGAYLIIYIIVNALFPIDQFSNWKNRVGNIFRKAK
jgi:O-antigen/teichoic acid export membrane protein